MQFTGPPITDQSLLKRLPAAYANLLRQVNGFVAFRGGFHMRGICDEPEWHSLAEAWIGENALFKLFAAIEPDDVPFGQSPILRILLV